MKVSMILIYIFIFTLTVSCSTSKYNVTNKYISTVLESYPKLPPYSDDHFVFWEYIRKNNKELGRYLKDNSNLANQARKQCSSIINELNQHFDGALYPIDSEEEAFMKEVCGSLYYRFISRVIVEKSSDINAYCYPNGNIFVTTKMFDFIGKDKYGLLGIIAHEVAHCTLKHHNVKLYADMKQKRKNDNLALLTSALAGAVVSGAMITHAGSGARFTEENGQQYSNILLNIGKVAEIEFDMKTIKQKFEYSREQEIEADIVACLYLIWIGKEPKYFIRSLSRIDAVSGSNYRSSQYDDHPSMNFRVSKLKHIFYSN